MIQLTNYLFGLTHSLARPLKSVATLNDQHFVGKGRCWPVTRQHFPTVFIILSCTNGNLNFHSVRNLPSWKCIQCNLTLV